MEFTEIDQTDSSKAESGKVNGNAINSETGMRFKLNKHGKQFRGALTLDVAKLQREFPLLILAYVSNKVLPFSPVNAMYLNFV